jgi:hypothetical protein
MHVCRDPYLQGRRLAHSLLLAAAPGAALLGGGGGNHGREIWWAGVGRYRGKEDLAALWFYLPGNDLITRAAHPGPR